MVARCVLAAVLMAVVIVSAWASGEIRPPGRVVLLMGPETEEAPLAELAAALDAQLSDLDAEVKLRLVEQVPDDAASQFAMVRSVGQSEGLLSVVWVQRTAGELIVFIADRGSEKLTVLALPQEAGSWRADCDAVATSVRSMLLPWLQEEREEARASAGLRAAPPLATEPEGIVEERSAPRGFSLALNIALGWTAVGIDPAIRWMHGADIEAALIIGSYLQIGAGLAVMPPLDMEIAGRDVRLSRWPLEAFAAGILPLLDNRLELCARLGLLVDVTAVLGLEAGSSPDDTDALRLALSPALLARLRVLPGLWVWTTAGAHFFARDRDYLWDDEPVLRGRAVQPRFGMGLGFRLPVGEV